MAAFFGQSVNSAASRWIAPGGAALAGAAVAALFLLLPADMLEDWVWRSGIAALIPAAQPPLGATARAVLALGMGGTAAAVTWSALFLLFGPGGWLAPRAARGDAQDEGLPVLRRADAHPDAPARRPLSAADLGAPMPPAHAAPAGAAISPLPAAPAGPPAPPPVQPIPADLDQPLAAFHPAALPEVPREPVRPVAPLRPPVALVSAEPAGVEPPAAAAAAAAAPAPPPPAPASGPGDATAAPSIEALLDRLEQGARRPLRI